MEKTLIKTTKTLKRHSGSPRIMPGAESSVLSWSRPSTFGSAFRVRIRGRSLCVIDYFGHLDLQVGRKALDSGSKALPE